jgi:hypothetical protein
MVLEELGLLLQGAGHGTLGSTLFLYQLPDEPDVCIALRGYEGAAPEYTHGGAMPAFERPRFQLSSRAPLVDEAMAAAWAAWKTLSVIRNAAVGGVTYLAVNPMQTPFVIERDENNRWVAGANFEVWKEVS